MATSLKVLGQVNSNTPGANTDADLYTVPAATQTVVSSIVVCNRSTAATFQIRVRVAGAGSDNKQFIAKDMAIAANTTVAMTLGVTPCRLCRRLPRSWYRTSTRRRWRCRRPAC